MFKTSQKWHYIVLGLVLALFSCEKENATTSTIGEEINLGIVENDLHSWIAEAENEAAKTGKKSFGEVQTVPFVDIERYTGRWFELAKFPNAFELGCSCTTAQYAIIPGGVSVFNNCTVPQGFNLSITGSAIVDDPVSNSKLKVIFDEIPVPGDYWIIDLVENGNENPYEFAVVSDPLRENLFILSRTPQITTFKQKKAIIKILINLIFQGYDLRKIELTPQPASCIYAD